MDRQLIDFVLALVKNEYVEATTKHPSFNSAHEGYAVILEEMDELWAEVKAREQQPIIMLLEAKQVAAMAVRFIVDVCGVELHKVIREVSEPNQKEIVKQ